MAKQVSTFKERLCELCAAVPEDDAAIAQGIGVSETLLRAWKCGEQTPNDVLKCTVAWYFEADVHWLCGEDVDVNPVPDGTEIDFTTDELLLLRMYRASGQAQRRAAFELLAAHGSVAYLGS